MNAEFVYKNEKFIRCENCGYDRSFHLEADVEYEIFNWDCPQCDQHWGGIILSDGSIEIERLQDRETRFVIIEIAEPWSPFYINATRAETPEETAQRGGRPASKFRNFYLDPCEPNPEINPTGLAQFKARDF